MDTPQIIEFYSFILFYILSIWTYFYNDKFFKFVHILKNAEGIKNVFKSAGLKWTVIER